MAASLRKKLRGAEQMEASKVAAGMARGGGGVTQPGRRQRAVTQAATTEKSNAEEPQDTSEDQPLTCLTCKQSVPESCSYQQCADHCHHEDCTCEWHRKKEVLAKRVRMAQNAGPGRKRVRAYLADNFKRAVPNGKKQDREKRKKERGLLKKKGRGRQQQQNA